MVIGCYNNGFRYFYYHLRWIDHTEFLGNTIDSIALEKAGVMRPLKYGIFADENPPSAILNYAKNNSTSLLIHHNDFESRIYKVIGFGLVRTLKI